MGSPTREDAQLMMQLAQWGTGIGLQDALPKLWSDDFDPETADPMDKSVQTLLGFGETLGTLTKHELISVELVKDWLWIEGMWGRVAPAAMKARDKAGEPRLYENFEALAKG